MQDTKCKCGAVMVNKCEDGSSMYACGAHRNRRSQTHDYETQECLRGQLKLANEKLVFARRLMGESANVINSLKRESNVDTIAGVEWSNSVHNLIDRLRKVADDETI